MRKKVCHQDKHGNGNHAVTLHLVVEFRHGDCHAGVAEGHRADNDARAAEHERKFLTENQSDDHQDEQHTDEYDLDITAVGERDGEICQQSNHDCASFPSADAGFFAANSTIPRTCLSISETVCAHNSDMPIK